MYSRSLAAFFTSSVYRGSYPTLYRLVVMRNSDETYPLDLAIKVLERELNRAILKIYSVQDQSSKT